MSPYLLLTLRQFHAMPGLVIGNVWDSGGIPYRFHNVIRMWAP